MLLENYHYCTFLLLIRTECSIPSPSNLIKSIIFEKPITTSDNDNSSYLDLGLDHFVHKVLECPVGLHRLPSDFLRPILSKLDQSFHLRTCLKSVNFFDDSLLGELFDDGGTKRNLITSTINRKGNRINLSSNMFNVVCIQMAQGDPSCQSKSMQEFIFSVCHKNTNWVVRLILSVW